MAKTVNYTTEMLTFMATAYMAVRSESQAARDAVVSELAAKYGKGSKSIVSKLAAMRTEEGEKLYLSKVKLSSTTGEPAAKKEVFANRLRVVTGLPLVNIEKTNKDTIQALISFAKEANQLEAEYDDLSVWAAAAVALEESS